MSDDGFSIKRAGGPQRIANTTEAVEAGAAAEVRRVSSAQFARSNAIPREVETAEALPSELGGSIDLRLFERMNAVLVSPAISSMTHRSNVLHSVVSWLDAQSARLSTAEGGAHAEVSNQLPWLGSVIDILKEEITLIEAFHQGTVRDVESPLE